VNVNKKRFLEVLEAASEIRKDKIAVLKKAIMEGTYQVKADDIARKILKKVFFEFLLTPNKPQYRGCSNN
jgi:hypothetical protein